MPVHTRIVAVLISLAVWSVSGVASFAQAPDEKPHAGPPLLPLVDDYNPQNQFALILRGEQNAHKVYEDAFVLAFMDRAPVEPGHVLVISKTSRARNLLEVDPKVLSRLMAVAQRVGKAQVAALGAQGFTIIQNNGAGQTVPHLHIHVIPRMTTRPLVLGIDKRADPEDLKALADKLSKAMK